MDGYYIGLMSGTSMDAVDAVLIEIHGHSLTTLAHAAIPLGESLRRDLQKLCSPGDDGLDLLGFCDIALGKQFATAAMKVLEQYNLPASAVTAIGSHGQTVRHRPPGHDTPGFSLQIGDPSTIAALTGITTIADFRRKDMALGGQGAPLVPAFHHYLFRHADHNRTIINIGGIANITWLAAGGDDSSVIGFDTGPGNGLMDAWIQRHRGLAFDRDGAWAASGTPDIPLLSAMLEDDYLHLPAPKSTGREYFNIHWLDSMLARLTNLPSPADVQATLCAFTVETIALGLNTLPAACDQVYLCGGGTYNSHLVRSLAQRLRHTKVSSCSALGLAPEQVEATAFAWLAHRTLERQPGNLSRVTGASRPAILGGIYWP